MFILGLQGSPRIKGNTNYLLNMLLSEAQKRGAVTRVLHAPRLGIRPCTGCGNCEEKGFCAISDDDMTKTVYPLLRRADAVILASPVYFYSVTAQIKALIDRSQALWARRYRHGLNDPGRGYRKGFMVSVGATRGKNLFDGMSLTARYFFDAIGSEYTGMIGYRRIEEPGQIESQPGLKADVKALIDQLAPAFGRRKILFACRQNACRSQMASAFARMMAGDRVEAFDAGSMPADRVNPGMIDAMGEIGIDMAYRQPRSIESVLEEVRPDMIITMGCGEQCPYIPAVEYVDWDIPDPAGQPIEIMRQVRDEIKERVERLTADQPAR